MSRPRALSIHGLRVAPAAVHLIVDVRKHLQLSQRLALRCNTTQLWRCPPCAQSYLHQALYSFLSTRCKVGRWAREAVSQYLNVALDIFAYPQIAEMYLQSLARRDSGHAGPDVTEV